MSNSNSYNGEVIDISVMIRKLKKYFTVWLSAAIACAFLSLCGSAIYTTVKKPELKALVGFSYDGIDKGLDPNGKKFDINTLKSPAVIEMALTEMNIDIAKLEDIRNGITFEKIIPASAYDRFTVYNNILEKGGSDTLEAGEKLLETSYYPTRFTVVFDYNETGFSTKEAADVFNVILEKYDEYFYKTYGYNESLGNAVSAISYEEYDYSEAVDVFSNSLGILKRYVKQLSNEDNTRFRSTVTGYTFDDLYSSINTIQSIDLDSISSYIVRNNVTKNKAKAITYTEYRIESLIRQKAECEEKIATYGSAIDKYEKDQVLVFGGTENINAQSNVASAQYDKMFSQQNSVADELAETKQSIDYYQKRLLRLQSSTLNSNVDTKEVEADLASLSEKVDDLIQLVSDTSEDYYRSVTFGNAYNILVPASSSSVNVFKVIVENMIKPLAVLEVLAVMVYFLAAFVSALKKEDDDEEKKTAEKEKTTIKNEG